ncbi:MAG: hypothetical protein J5486_08385 [Bacteroidaceae bacterium]|nr:hypothetical protein [Bacteroidaceae bacterium]
MDKRLEKLLNENFEEFLKEIGQVDLLTCEEELALLKAGQEKRLDSEEAEQLVKANLRFVVSLAAQYQNRGLSLAQLITIGAEELRKSILSYDPNSGTKFITHSVALMRARFEEETEK